MTERRGQIKQDRIDKQRRGEEEGDSVCEYTLSQINLSGLNIFLLHLLWLGPLLLVLFLALPALFLVPVSFTVSGIIDWPPQFFTTIRWSAQNYTNPAFGGSEVTTCDTSADCTACPAKIQGDTKTVVGCGCIKSVCVAGTEFLDFYSYYPDTAPNEYYCAVFYN